MSIPRRVVVIALAVVGSGGGALVSPDSAAGAAGPASSSRAAEPCTRVEMRFDETVEHLDLDLRWLELDDSRCPTGVTCVWEGRIVVTLEARRGEEEPVELELVLQAGHAPRAARAFGYDLVLQGVRPHPRPGVSPERSDHVAIVEVTGP